MEGRIASQSEILIEKRRIDAAEARLGMTERVEGRKGEFQRLERVLSRLGEIASQEKGERGQTTAIPIRPVMRSIVDGKRQLGGCSLTKDTADGERKVEDADAGETILLEKDFPCLLLDKAAVGEKGNGPAKPVADEIGGYLFLDPDRAKRGGEGIEGDIQRRKEARGKGIAIITSAPAAENDVFIGKQASALPVLDAASLALPVDKNRPAMD